MKQKALKRNFSNCSVASVEDVQLILSPFSSAEALAHWDESLCHGCSPEALDQAYEALKYGVLSDTGFSGVNMSADALDVVVSALFKVCDFSWPLTF